MSHSVRSLLKKIDHLGIAVEDLDQAVALYTVLTGAPPKHYEDLPSEKVRTAFFSVGEANFELLEATDSQSPIARFIQKNGRGGVHHVCVSVENIVEKMAELKSAGMILIDENPRHGAQGKLVAFVHPKSTGGVLIELSQEK